MKTITQRNLPLDTKYVVVDKKYIPVLEGGGACCDNCGRLIANIATVKNETSDIYYIGFDCLETILINNNLLSSQDVEDYERVKKMIPKVIRFSKHIKDVLAKNPQVTGILFEKSSYKTDYQTFYWLSNGNLSSRDNDYYKLKDMDFNFMTDTLKNIFQNLTILIK